MSAADSAGNGGGPPEAARNILFEDAARKRLLSALSKIEDNLSGTRAGAARREATPEQVEALHDLRVGTRRLRAALAVFGPILPPKRLAQIDKEVGDLTDSLGAVRDLDVQLESLRSLASSLPSDEAFGIDRLIARQTRLRDRERRRLRETLDRFEKDNFTKRLREALDKALPTAKADSPRPGERA